MKISNLTSVLTASVLAIIASCFSAIWIFHQIAVEDFCECQLMMWVVSVTGLIVLASVASMTVIAFKKESENMNEKLKKMEYEEQKRRDEVEKEKWEKTLEFRQNQEKVEKNRMHIIEAIRSLKGDKAGSAWPDEEQMKQIIDFIDKIDSKNKK